MAEPLDLGSLLGEAFDALALGLWTTLPATVVSFQDGTLTSPPTATLQPFPYDYAGGDPVALPQLSGVPVCFQKGVRAPLDAGDVVLVHFSSRSLERWRGGDGTGDPQSFRHHDLSDGFCVPQVASLNAMAVGTSPKAARVGDDIGAGTLSFTCAATVLPAPPGVIITLTYTPPGGVAQIQTVTLTGALTGAAVGVPANLAGTITTGSATVEIDD